MLEVERWAKDKPPLLASVAVQLVSFSDFLYDVLPQAKERCLFSHQFPLPEFSSWYRLYRTPLKPLIAFANMITEFHESGAILISLFFAYRKVQKLLKNNPNYYKENPPSPEELQQGISIFKDLCALPFELIKDDLDPQPVDPVEQARLSEYLTNHEQELGFFFFLFVPSLFIYQTSPHILYREAVTGDIDSIEKLLKLDPLMLHEPIIGQQIQILRFSNKINEYERITSAAHKLAVTNYSDIEHARKRSKVVLASIISVFSQLVGHPLNSSQIAHLFDCYSKDKEEGDADSDIPGGESFNKAIKRHSLPWHNLFQNLDNKK